MSTRGLPPYAVVCLLLLCGAWVFADLTLHPLVAPPDIPPGDTGDPITGPSGLEIYFGSDPFDPNNTWPELQLGGEGSEENSGGLAVFKTESFYLDLSFLNAHDNLTQPSFQNMFLTAAFWPGKGFFEKIRFFDPDDPLDFVELSPAVFADSRAFGLPFPPDSTIKGIAVGAADFMTLDGAIIAGVDLGIGLQRVESADPPTVRLGVQVVEPEYGKTVMIRFDVFGMNQDGSLWNVQGNNPGSGSAGFFIPEPSSLSLALAGIVALALRRRKRRTRTPA